jgi:hypothetical protein
MWYDSYMPEHLPVAALADAEAAVNFARQVRKFHARRTERGSKQREADIEIARTRLKECMAPLKSAIGKFPYGPQTDAAEENRNVIREASQACQRERRKLHKMKVPTVREPSTV